MTQLTIKTNSLFNSEFLNYAFSRPSTSKNNVSAFSTKSIDLKIGRYFSSRDLKVFNHIFYNFLIKFNYPNKPNYKLEYEEFLNITKSPFDFEKKIYLSLKNSHQLISDFTPYKLYRKNLLQTFNILKIHDQYPVDIKPI